MKRQRDASRQGQHLRDLLDLISEKMDGIHNFPLGEAKRPLERNTCPRLQGLKVFLLNIKDYYILT